MYPVGTFSASNDFKQEPFAANIIDAIHCSILSKQAKVKQLFLSFTYQFDL